MSRNHPWVRLVVYSLAATLLVGCVQSSTSKSESDPSGTNEQSKTESSKSEDGQVPKGYKIQWDKYPNVPFVQLMDNVDGINIPRVTSKSEIRDPKGKIAEDVGNPSAKKDVANGDWLIIRFPSEPQSLNPIIEQSAVQTYICEYTLQSLYETDGETLEVKPLLAENYVAEDSIKLSADYPGKERRIKQSDGELATMIEIDNTKGKNADDNSSEITLTTTDKSGTPIGGVWLGIYPVGSVAGLPPHGRHEWSNAQGELTLSDLPTGKLAIKVGAEVFGTSQIMEDESLTVTPKTSNNPLADELKADGQTTLTLQKSEYQERHQDVYFTYTIRKAAKWSDGEPFTSKDMEFAYAVMQNAYVDGDSIRIYYQNVIACDALDKQTIRFRYRQQYFKSFETTRELSGYAPPWHLFSKFFAEEGKTLTLERLTEAQEIAQNKVSAHGQTFGKFFNNDRRYNDAPLGTGPYIIDKWVQKDRVELVRNPTYWNTDKAGHLDRIIIKFIPNDVTALQALKAGEIDFLYRMSAEQFFDGLAGEDWVDAKYVKAQWYSPAYSYVGWNMLNPIFADRRVRIALSLLFDTQEFLEKKLHNAGVLVSGSQYVFGPAYDRTVKPLGYDPDTAAELLADAGWIDSDGDGILDKDGIKLEFDMWVPTGKPTVIEQLEIMQKNYKQAGIVMNVQKSEWATFIDKIKKKEFGACRLAWASPLESDPYQLFHGSGSGAEKRGSNHVSYNSSTADKLIETAQVTLDPMERARVFWSLHRLLDRDQPYLFLYTPKEFGVYGKRFRGVKWYPERPGFDLSEWYVPKDEQVH